MDPSMIPVGSGRKWELTIRSKNFLKVKYRAEMRRGNERAKMSWVALIC